MTVVYLFRHLSSAVVASVARQFIWV